MKKILIITTFGDGGGGGAGKMASILENLFPLKKIINVLNFGIC